MELICPWCGGELPGEPGQFVKCRHCRSDIFWGGGKPWKTRKEAIATETPPDFVPLPDQVDFFETVESPQSQNEPQDKEASLPAFPDPVPVTPSVPLTEIPGDSRVNPRANHAARPLHAPFADFSDDMALSDWLRDERLGLPIWGWFGILNLLFLIALGIAIYLSSAKKAGQSPPTAGPATPLATTPPATTPPATDSSDSSSEPVVPPVQSLLGKWLVQSWRKNGKETVNVKAPPTFKFSQDTLFITLVEPTAEKQGVVDGGKYTADTDTTPKSFAMQSLGNETTTTVFWIYEFTNSGLRLCKSTTETKPKEFSDSSGFETIVLKRMEPEKVIEESAD